MIFGIGTLKFAKLQKIGQNKQTNKQKVGLKIPYLGILGRVFEKVLSYFQHPRIC